MKNQSLILLLLSIAVLSGGFAVLEWWVMSGNERLELRKPGADGVPEGTFEAGSEELWTFKGELTPGAGRPSTQIQGQWSQFRGDSLTMSWDDESIRLAREWPANGPQELWSVDVGDGYAGAAVRNGRVYLLDYDEARGGDVVRCLSLDDGEEIWHYFYSVKVKRDHGMSRTVPAVNDAYVVTIGPRAQVLCLDAKTGQHLWHIDMAGEYGTQVPLWHAAQCPLLVGDEVILAPAGPECLMMAVSCQSGEIVWKAANPDGWKMTHTSILPIEVDGQVMYVYCGSGGVAGVAADSGEVLWRNKDWKMRTNVPSPLNLGEGRLYLCAGYNKGSTIIDVKKDGAAWQGKTIGTFSVKVFGTVQHSPVYYQGHLYGIRERRKQLVCLDRNGVIVWESGSDHTFGDGPILRANELIYILDDDGTLFMVEASAKGYRELGQFQVFDGHDAWGPMAMVAGRLILRDFDTLKCLDMRMTGAQ